MSAHIHRCESDGQGKEMNEGKDPAKCHGRFVDEVMDMRRELIACSLMSGVAIMAFAPAVVGGGLRLARHKQVVGADLDFSTCPLVSLLLREQLPEARLRGIERAEIPFPIDERCH